MNVVRAMAFVSVFQGILRNVECVVLVNVKTWPQESNTERHIVISVLCRVDRKTPDNKWE